MLQALKESSTVHEVFATRSWTAHFATSFIRCASFSFLLMLALALWHRHKASSMYDGKLLPLRWARLPSFPKPIVDDCWRPQRRIRPWCGKRRKFEFHSHGFRIMYLLCRRCKKKDIFQFHSVAPSVVSIHPLEYDQPVLHILSWVAGSERISLPNRHESVGIRGSILERRGDVAAV